MSPLKRIPDWVVDNYRWLSITGTIVFAIGLVIAVWHYIAGATPLAIYDRAGYLLISGFVSMVAGFIAKEFGE